LQHRAAPALMTSKLAQRRPLRHTV